MSGCFAKRLRLICFYRRVLYEFFHYASNTIFYPHASPLPESKGLENRRIGDALGQCDIWMLRLGESTPQRDMLLGACNRCFFQFAALTEKDSCS